MDFGSHIKLWEKVVVFDFKGLADLLLFFNGYDLGVLLEELRDLCHRFVHPFLCLVFGNPAVRVSIEEVVIEYLTYIRGSFRDCWSKVFIRLHDNELVGFIEFFQDCLLTADKVRGCSALATLLFQLFLKQIVACSEFDRDLLR